MIRRHFLQRGAALLGALSAAPLLAETGWKESATLPDLSAFGLEGTLPKTKDKVLYLDFWASWCGPCKTSFPVLNAWQKKYDSRGLVILGVSVDESAAAMQAFLKKTPASFPVVRDAAHKLVGVANVSTMPTSILVDRKGVIRLVHGGFRAKDETTLAAHIEKLLG